MMDQHRPRLKLLMRFCSDLPWFLLFSVSHVCSVLIHGCLLVSGVREDERGLSGPNIVLKQVIYLMYLLLSTRNQYPYLTKMLSDTVGFF